MRILHIALALLALAASAPAQLLAVRFKDQKSASKYKQHLVLHGGRMVVVGEALMNVRVDLATNVITRTPGKSLEFLVADPGDPTKVPYKFDGDTRVVTDKRAVVEIPEPLVEDMQFFIRDSNLAGLASDYAERKRTLDEVVAARAGAAKGSPEWMIAHQRVLVHMERLLSWLDSTLYPEAARKLEKDLVKERKLVGEAVAARGAAAKASVKMVETPAELSAASEAISGGTDKFHVAQSLHVRIVFLEEIGDERIQGLLEFAEQVIEGFRIELVDPYLDAAYEDHIPERMFSEFWFGPDDVEKHERYFTEYFRREWGEHKKELLEAAGTSIRRSTSPEFLEYWRYNDTRDLEGIVAHRLGHHLANVHYDRNRLGMEQDWLEEGLGFYLALEWLGNNSVTCGAFSEPGKYVHQRKKEGDKTVQLGLRDYYNALALQQGPTVDKLALKTLYELGDADFAKCWSFFDFIARKGGKEGQLFLRAGCNAARTKATFIKDWRVKAEEIFEIEGQDVFDVLEKRWRAFAEIGQDTGDTKRAK